MTRNLRATKSKRIRKHEKKNKTATKKPKNDLPKPVFEYRPLPDDKYKVEFEDEVDEVEFNRSDNHGIHYIEPTEKELLELVEYDMDDQDLEYLGMINEKRRKEGFSNVTEHTFESVINRIEKIWYELVKDLPNDNTIGNENSEEIPCAICDESEVDNSNAIVFCDGCNLPVHQDCYGIPHIPEGRWLCRKCALSPDKPVSCVFCPNKGGAFKQIRNRSNQWGHLLCAFWIPEVGISDPVYMEQIDPLDVVPQFRRQQTCFICKKKKNGVCIECDCKSCHATFHPTCARLAKFYMRMIQTDNDVKLRAFCNKHSPKGYQYNAATLQANIADVYKNSKNTEDDDTVNEEAKPAVANQYPEFHLSECKMLELESLEVLREYRGKQRAQIVTDITRYWSLKREMTGAPLVKRLTIEPWSVKTPSEDIDPVDRYNATSSLRLDLEKIRILSERVKKRERLKLDVCRAQIQYIEGILFPMDIILIKYLEQFMDLDKDELFMSPPNTDDADVDPNSLTAIYLQLRDHSYQNIDEFIAAVTHVWEHIINNSNIYKKRSQHMKAALKLKRAAPSIFSKAREEWAQMQLDGSTTSLDMPIDPAIFEYNTKELDNNGDIPALTKRKRGVDQEEEEKEEKETRKGKKQRV